MATVTRYVNTASTAGGDGTTNATTGVNRAYASASEWEADEQTDLVAAGDTHIVHCDGAGGADTAGLIVSGWTTGASNGITIVGTNGYSLTSNTFSGTLQLLVGHVTVRGFDVISTGTVGQGFRHGIYITGDSVTIERVTATGGAGNANSDAVRIAASTGTFDAVMAKGAGGKGFHVFNFRDPVLNNCAAVGNATGFERAGTDGTAPTANNCYAYDNTTGFVGSHWSGNYNASDDSTEVGSNAITTDLVSGDFTDYAGGDYTPASGGTLAGAGSATYSPATDLAGNAFASPPSVGPYEVVVTGSDGTAAGTSTATAVGASTAEAAGTASGAGAAAGVGASTAESAAASAGTSSATAVGAPTFSALGSSAGTSTVSGVGTVAGSSGTAAGTSTATAVGRSTHEAAGTASGAASVTGVAESTGSVGTAAGTSTASAVGSSTYSAAGTAAGTSTVRGISPRLDPATRIVPLRRQTPISQDGVMALHFAAWQQLVTELEIIEGNGSPEGVVSASKKRLYMDRLGTAGSILYIKRDADISGDTTQGWIAI